MVKPYAAVDKLLKQQLNFIVKCLIHLLSEFYCSIPIIISYKASVSLCQFDIRLIKMSCSITLVLFKEFIELELIFRIIMLDILIKN